MERIYKHLYHIAAFLIVAIWGTTFISTKILLRSGISPEMIFLIRFTIAYIGIWILCLKEKKSRRLLSRKATDELIFIVLGITGGSLYFYTENTALLYTQACNVSFIVCSAPLWTTILTILTKRITKDAHLRSLESVRVNGWLLVGTILALFGMALMLFNGYQFTLSPKGDLLAFAAALCWSTYSIFMVEMTKRYGTLFATRKVFSWGVITMIPFAIGEIQNLSTDIFLTGGVVANILFLSVVASLICFVLWNKVMERLGNVTATNYVYLNPIFTLIGSIIFLNEHPTPISAVGSAMILTGVILSGKH